RLLTGITKSGAAFTATITSGTGNLTGTPASAAGVNWALAELELIPAPGPLTGQTWKVQLTRAATIETFTYTAQASDTITTVAKALGALIDQSLTYQSDVKYETATLTTAWPTD